MENAKAGFIALLGGAVTGGAVYYFFFHKKKLAPLAAKTLPTLGTQVSYTAPKASAPSYSTPKTPTYTPVAPPPPPASPYSDRKPSSTSAVVQKGQVIDSGEIADPSGLPWAYKITAASTESRIGDTMCDWTVRYVGPTNKVYGLPAPMSGKGASSISSALDRIQTAVIGWTARKQSEAADAQVESMFG
jgi:hypothetical protein